MEEFVKKAAQHRAGARLARVVPYDFDNEEKLDPMALLEEVMQHFYRKAKIEESLGRFCDFRIVDNALQNAARTAREIVSFDAAFLSQGQDQESLGRFCDFRIVDRALETAGRIAREIVSFRHPKISAIKLAVADPNADLLRGDMTADEMREIIRRKLEEEEGYCLRQYPRRWMFVEKKSATLKEKRCQDQATREQCHAERERCHRLKGARFRTRVERS